MEAKISSHRKLGSQDYLIEVLLGNATLAYGQVNGRKYVALGRNVSKLRKLFDSGGSGIVLARKYVYKVRD